MLKVGVTGNIGSGKTTVCKIFETLGVPVFYADAEAIETYSDPKIMIEVKSLLGGDIYVNNIIDRKKVAAATFNNQQKLEKLNAIIHPATVNKFLKWCAAQTSTYVLKEAAILFESGTDKGLDKIITIYATEEDRIKRVLARNINWTEKEVRDRMKLQWSDEEKMKRSDYVIYNDGSDFIITQVLKIHHELIQLAQSKI